MKLYTAEYDADRPSTKSVEVPLNSKFGVAVGVKYSGEDVKVRQNEILLDGLSASETLGDKYLVFKLSSDGEAGYDKYTVDTTTDGMTVKELNFKTEDYQLSSGKAVISVALPPEWIGVELYVDPTFSTNYDYSKNPFQACAKKADGTERWGQITYFLNEAGNTLAAINNKTQGFMDKSQEFWIPNPDGSITKTDTWTIPPECKTIYVGVSTASSYQTASIDYTYTERIKRQFQLYVKKADKGEIEGYGDDYVFKNTVNLSGTYEDDTDFSFDVPIVEE